MHAHKSYALKLKQGRHILHHDAFALHK